ncbi:hypothetical protein AB1285_25220 [Microbacterium sp. NRRL B-14842]|uniref:hypothetical protein n=1 Tax=Microbacterium sp. NRRL B-14842 TaxID=3162881 RepID=UPI003D2D9421
MQWQEFVDARQSGEFQLIVGGVVGTTIADPFQIYRDWFGGTEVQSTSPVGTEIPPGRWNFSRYKQPDRRCGHPAGHQHRGRGGAQGALRHDPGRDRH